MEVRYVGGTATAYAPYQGRTYEFPKDLDVVVPEGLAALLLPLDDFVPGDADAANYEPPAQTSSVPVRWRSDQKLVTEAGEVISSAGGGGHTIEGDGGSLPQRAVLRFAGPGVSLSDSGGKTVVTVSGGDGGSATLDGGAATTTYLSSQVFNGGNANG